MRLDSRQTDPLSPKPTTLVTGGLANDPAGCNPQQMNLRTAAATIFALALTLPLPLTAQERGYWKPTSKTAQSITGDVTFNGDRMTINFFTLTVAEIRSLKPDEISAAFSDVSPNENPEAPIGVGHLYRLSIPGDKRFLHKNTLCGSEETQWMATWVSGKQMQIAFFSNATPPVFTLEALRDSPNLCGTFSYAR